MNGRGYQNAKTHVSQLQLIPIRKSLQPLATECWIGIA